MKPWKTSSATNSPRNACLYFAFALPDLLGVVARTV